MNVTLHFLRRASVAASAALFFALPSCAQSLPKTWPFQPSATLPAPAALDLRFLNEKTAGETGFVKLTADGNGFALGSGKPVRFWAVGSDVYRGTADDMAKHARFLAKLGVNMVRLHTQIAPDVPNAPITNVNEKEIDGIWHMVAAMKKEGIYTTISPYWANGKETGAWGIDGYSGKTDVWGLLFFDEKLQAGYKTWVKALYGRPNPYTGIPLARDPAVAIIQVQNEDSLLFWTMQAMKPVQLEKLGVKFGQWLTKKYGSLDAARSAWDGAVNPGDNFAQGRVGLFNVYAFTQPQSGGMDRRISDELHFYADTQRQFYTDIAAYYRTELGCKQLVNASNWITADPIKLNDVERWTYTAADVLAVNKYTGGVHVGDNNGWRIDPGHHFTSDSNLRDPRALPTNLKQVAGHPMIVTESTWVSPEGYQTEGPFLIAAYESLTGVDAFYWFSATVPTYDPDPYFNFLNFPGGQHALHKWTASIPTLMAQFPAAALLFRRRYLKEGRPVVTENRPLADLWARKIPAIAEDKTFDPNRNEGNTRGQSDMEQGIDPLAFLVGPVVETFGGTAAKTSTVDLTKFIHRDKKTIRSVTGEVRLNYGAGICVMNAPKAQGVSGFLSKVGTLKLADVTVKSQNEYATIYVVSMDNKPLKTSGKILIQVGTQARPTGWETKPAAFKSDDGKQTFDGSEIVNTGHMPWQVTNTDATITVANPALKTATLLDVNGVAVRTIPVTHAGGKLTVKLPSNALYVILQ